MNDVMNIPTFCICENKGADQPPEFNMVTILCFSDGTFQKAGVRIKKLELNNPN